MENVPSETTAGEEPVQKTQKKGRHRKKQLFSSILHQMEFYFSDSNLTKDRFLAQLINENPYVNLEVFLKFNKIRKLTSNLEDLQKALKKSELIELSEDKTSVRRKNPVVQKSDVDGCTIYVQQLPLDFNHDRLTTIFSEFGKVVYVSIPRYKKTSAIKGFAFVEFDKEQEAQNALDYFEKIGQKMPASTEPEKLCSIATFEADTDKVPSTDADNTAAIKTDESQAEPDKGEDKGDPEQISVGEIDVKPETQPAVETEKQNVNKRKASEDSDTKIEAENDEKPTKKVKTAGEEVTVEETKPVTGDTEETKKKKKKKDKKKAYIKELGIQILSKKEWKKMRNRYLDMQRKQMKEFKQHLAKARFARQQQQPYNNVSNDDVDTKNAVKKWNKENGDTTVTNDDGSGAPTVPATDEVTPKIEFVKGVIVKLTLPELSEDVKKLKNEIRLSSADIKFVDASLTSQDVYIRFGSETGAQEYCSQPSENGTTKKVLQDEEEKAYWDKLRQDRDAKFKKTTKKQRGRDKLLKKANKILATHIKFEES